MSVARERDGGGLGIRQLAQHLRPIHIAPAPTHPIPSQYPMQQRANETREERTQTDTYSFAVWWALLCWSALERHGSSQVVRARRLARSLVAFLVQRRRCVAPRWPKPKAAQRPKCSRLLQRMNEQELDGRPRADGRGECPSSSVARAPFGPRGVRTHFSAPSNAPVFSLGSTNKRCGPRAASLSPSPSPSLSLQRSVPPPLTTTCHCLATTR